MQPYFFPYIGYFQLINTVDVFVVYDKIKFTKKGWIHRNRILVNGEGVYFSLTLKRDSDYLEVRDRYLCDQYLISNAKVLRRIQAAYRKAPFFRDVFSLLEKCLLHNERNLFAFIFNSLVKTTEYLGISTPIVISSSMSIDHSLKGKDKVLAICHKLGAQEYVNPPGGISLYDKSEFLSNNVSLNFLVPDQIVYEQMNAQFVPALSIIDVMMFNSPADIACYLNSYKLV